MAFKIIPPAQPNASSNTNTTGGNTGNPSPITPRPAGSPITPRPAGSPAPRPGGFQPRPARPMPSRDRNFGNKEDKDSVRLNERIRVPQVRLIDQNGEQVGIVDTRQALQMAETPVST